MEIDTFMLLQGGYEGGKILGLRIPLCTEHTHQAFGFLVDYFAQILETNSRVHVVAEQNSRNVCFTVEKTFCRSGKKTDAEFWVFFGPFYYGLSEWFS